MLSLLREIVPVVSPGVAPDADRIREAMQWGITLENAVIPPYLYALYSLKQGTNEEIAETIREIVNEEMLHLALACNLLNAIGGKPRIDDPSLVTAYPRRLPGTADTTPEVQLAPFSLAIVETIFKPIEAPEDPIDFFCPRCPAPPKPNPSPAKPTVGDLYRAISALLREAESAGLNLFKKGDPARQITRGIHGLIAVKDLTTANQAIAIIVDQGEGGSGRPTATGGDMSHYYKFDGITKGRALIKNPDATPADPLERQYIFDGPEITFDPNGVWSVPLNPRVDEYPVNSAARHAVDGFNYTYTSLLKCLDLMANGRPAEFAGAFGLMFSLQQQAMGMMSGVTPPGGHSIGPTFEYRAFNR